MAKEPEHRDKLNTLLAVDQYVICSSCGTGVHIGKVIKLTPKKVTVKIVGKGETYRTSLSRYPDEIIVIKNEDVLMYVLGR